MLADFYIHRLSNGRSPYRKIFFRATNYLKKNWKLIFLGLNFPKKIGARQIFLLHQGFQRFWSYFL